MILPLIAVIYVWTNANGEVQNSPNLSDAHGAAYYVTNAPPANPSAPAPTQFENGVAVPLTNGAWVVLEPQADGEPVIALRISNSPVGANWKQLRDEALARWKAKQAAEKARLDQMEADIKALKEKVKP